MTNYLIMSGLFFLWISIVTKIWSDSIRKKYHKRLGDIGSRPRNISAENRMLWKMTVSAERLWMVSFWSNLIGAVCFFFVVILGVRHG